MGGTRTLDRKGRIALAIAVLGLAVATGSTGTSVAASAHDRNDSAGPLDIADASFDQRNTKVSFQIRNRGALPSLKDLTRYPSRVGSNDQRYICLQLLGSKTGHNLYCPAGGIDGGKVKVGHSTYGGDGTASKRGSFTATVVPGRDDVLTLKFSLRDAGLVAGKIRWRVLTGWTGDECVPVAPPVEPPTEPALESEPTPSSLKGPLSADNLCRDRMPDSGYVADRIYKLQVASCKSPGGQFRSAPNAGKQVALTFDDGPSGYTNQVVDILDEYGAKGTFFVIGRQVSSGARVLRKALNHGHELANHSYNHESLPGASSMQATNSAIERATGFRPCEFRPPYGAVNSGVVSAANSLGMSTVLWDIDTNDWQTPGSGAIYSTATNAGPGSIVLMHDGGGNRSGTVAALPEIIRNLQGRGFKLVTVTEILGGKFKLEEKR